MFSFPRVIVTLLLLIAAQRSHSQSLRSTAERIRLKYHIPELGYAVVAADTVYEINLSGYKKAGSLQKAASGDRFRIGSNTKAITGVLAAMLVHKGIISWETKFFDLFPELRSQSDTAYYNMNLLQMLSMRSPLPGYTYTNEEPRPEQFSGDNIAQRLAFFTWALKQPPVIKPDMNLTNMGYVGAGLMLERATHQSYEELVAALGAQLHISFGLDNPNNSDSLQTWGHNAQLIPDPPGAHYKLNWLCAAGNINISLGDYVKYLQWIQAGLKGQLSELTKTDFEFLLFGQPSFSIGWFNREDKNGNKIAWNFGNPGTFLSDVQIDTSNNIAFVIFANAQTPEAEKGLAVLHAAIEKKYQKNVSRRSKQRSHN
ncbi:beta-lactamase family protein [Pseudoflavitalea sp. G-6-1-2]|uniref:serine hydrolase domain-containing protein n=1 Tax=Pseudoflavitalea sp. G-6-1-2 TaxID=2728841 RepID=UPI00146D4968|nr:serine hydrolase domain-containing protein [Pseudoflavitalea sp. G-6-1-2]NML21389.1 beta-lactamase family protein [Pseudoflavitalea sp. G-6-1-2]